MYIYRHIWHIQTHIDTHETYGTFLESTTIVKSMAYD